ncbi:MAG TPA: hypothetical protein VF209_04305 [Patescibacteria group bacterium]
MNCVERNARFLVDTLQDVPYKKAHGPLSEVNVDDLWTDGLNCQLFFHLVWEELFGWVLPRWMRSSELYADTNFLQEVKRGEERPGDVLFLGRAEWIPSKRPDCRQAQQLHLATIVVADQNPLLIHMRWQKGERGGVMLESLSQVQQCSRYERLFAIKRRK